MMEKYKLRKRLAGAALIVLGGLGLAACSESEPNYAGVGNSFEVRGIVAGVEDDGTIHISEKQIVIVAAQGRAQSWFANGDGQDTFSDEFNFEPRYRQKEDGLFGECKHDIEVGKVHNTNGQEITPEDLRSGEVVDIQGHIRDSNTKVGKTCGIEEYPVFDTVQAQEGALR